MRVEINITVGSRMVSSVRCSLVVVADAVDVAVVVDGEGNAVQSLGANDTAKTAGVVGVAKSLQDLRRRHSQSHNDAVQRGFEQHLTLRFSAFL